MRYRIMCSTEWGDDYVYCEDKDTANMLFGILADSKLFSYVSLKESTDVYSLEREWVADHEA